jgi:Family of unknown function (DUF5678)
MGPQARIDALKNAPANGWVAFSEDEERVVAYASTYDEVVEMAEKNGVTEPVIVKIPENWNDRVLAS